MLLNIRWPQNHAVSRSGLYLFNSVTTLAIAAGGRAVNSSSSGDLMKSGKRKAPTVVTREKTTRAILPIRPMSPKVSVDCAAS